MQILRTGSNHLHGVNKSENIEKWNNADIDDNPNQKTTSTKYKTLLIIACENRYYHKVRLLIKAGAMDIKRCLLLPTRMNI